LEMSEGFAPTTCTQAICANFSIFWIWEASG
jgi:hypothetical protein